MQRPKTKQVTLTREGEPEKVTFTRFDALRFPLPFTTYVPPDIAAETAASGEGQAIRFLARFGGIRNENAYLQVGYVPGIVREKQAGDRARRIAASRGLRRRTTDTPRRFAWSRAEYDFLKPARNGPAQRGTVAVGRHRGRYFLVIVNYPEDYEEGFVPRAERLLAEWRWEDTGRALVRE